jgi:O-antigen ligase
MDVGVLAGLYWLLKPNMGLYRWLWLAPLGVMGYALLLTGSRGGMIGLLVGLLIFLHSRFGTTMTVVLGAIVLPSILLLASARQASLSTEEGTSQARIQLWSDGLVLLRESPIFGIGHDQYAERAGQVAHNSYLHCFTELGFFGGTLFLGAFYLTLRRLVRLGSAKAMIIDPELRNMQPFITGILAAYMVGMLSLTLPYVLPTYTVLAFATSYTNMTRTDMPRPAEQFDFKLWSRLAVVSVIFLVCAYLFVRVFMLRG